ncbi:uncharacterized protein LOC133530973 isoform X2 [Cydia pomonella]|uniref:uncharacterized protein LOC133530973 isoform X2 n=1 Tax=Cydia pomonella TaxID=82600 RepID=UPI002ADDB0B9|nr:uncharacterized protein LOC133530973 isoform X2 [Cydia pomonella]
MLFTNQFHFQHLQYKMYAYLIFVVLLLPFISSYYDDYLSPVRNVILSRESQIEYPHYHYPSGWLRQKTKKPKKPRKEPTAKEVIKIIPTNLPKNPSLNRSVFSLLRSEQKDANKTDEKEYPWIARVVHSPDKDHPYLCTAACIEDRIFVTAARCIYQAKVSFTTVINQGSRLRPRAFVVPSKPTKQMFDDIGFIVVSKTNHTWNAVKVFDKQDNEMFTRTDENYFWLSKMGEIEGTAVGFVNGDQKQSGTLYQANVYISPFICQHFYNTEILQEPKYYSDHYFVPCFHTCDLMDGYSRYKCNRRLAGEGHVILEEKSKKLIGIATWGGYFAKSIGINLPVGMAVLNSDNFQEDLECARMIKNAPVTSKTFSNLCK